MRRSLTIVARSSMYSCRCFWIRTDAQYRDGWASIDATTAAIDGFRLSETVIKVWIWPIIYWPPAGGWVTSAPMKITGSVKIFGLIVGTRILLIPPSLTLILRHKFDNVWGDVLLTFLTWTHCVAIPEIKLDFVQKKLIFNFLRLGKVQWLWQFMGLH